MILWRAGEPQLGGRNVRGGPVRPYSPRVGAIWGKLGQACPSLFQLVLVWSDWGASAQIFLCRDFIYSDEKGAWAQLGRSRWMVDGWPTDGRRMVDGWPTDGRQMRRPKRAAKK
eukprot:gene10575-biopygen7775